MICGRGRPVENPLKQVYFWTMKYFGEIECGLFGEIGSPGVLGDIACGFGNIEAELRRLSGDIHAGLRFGEISTGGLFGDVGTGGITGDLGNPGVMGEASTGGITGDMSNPGIC
jgi:hypothetical protein